MYNGRPLTYALGFAFPQIAADFFTMLPSNISGPGGPDGIPPARRGGTPNYYVQQSLTSAVFRVRKFTAGTNCGAGGTLGPTNTVGSQNSYTVASGNIVPQPNTTALLDSGGRQLMQKNQYRRVRRRFDFRESLWVTHAFRSSAMGPTGSQWAQIDVTGGTIAGGAAAIV